MAESPFEVNAPKEEGEYLDVELPILSKSEFLAALEVYLDKLSETMENELEKEESAFMGAISGLLPWADSAREAVEKVIEETRDWYISIVEAEGVGEWIPDYEEILTVGAPNLMNFATEQAQQQAIADAMEKALKDLRDAEENRQYDESMAQRKEEFEYQKEQNELTRKYQAGQDLQDRLDKYWERNRQIGLDYNAALMDRLTTRQESDWERGTREQQAASSMWEEIRNELLAEMGNEPQNWIEKYQLESKKNPYQSTETPEQTQEQWAEQYQNQIDYWQIELDDMREDAIDPTNFFTETPEVRETERWLSDAIKNAKRTLRNIKTGIPVGGSTWASQFMGGSQYQGVPGVPGLQTYQEVIDMANRFAVNPNAPEFANMPQSEIDAIKGMISDMGGIPLGKGFERGFAYPETKPTPELNMPSWLQSGVLGSPSTVSMTGPAEALTPSGQWWSRLVPAQKEMWAGYTEHAGQRPQDLLSGMQSMLPKNLRLGKTWQTTRR